MLAANDCFRHFRSSHTSNVCCGAACEKQPFSLSLSEYGDMFIGLNVASWGAVVKKGFYRPIDTPNPTAEHRQWVARGGSEAPLLGAAVAGEELGGQRGVVGEGILAAGATADFDVPLNMSHYYY